MPHGIPSAHAAHRARALLAMIVSAVLVMFGLAAGSTAAVAADAESYTIRGHISVPGGVTPADYLADATLGWYNDSWTYGADNAYGTLSLDKTTGDYEIRGVDAGRYSIELAGSTTIGDITVQWRGAAGANEPAVPCTSVCTGAGTGVGLDSAARAAVYNVAVVDQDVVAPDIETSAFGRVSIAVTLADPVVASVYADVWFEVSADGDGGATRGSVELEAGQQTASYSFLTGAAATYSINAYYRVYDGENYTTWDRIGSFTGVVVNAWTTTTLTVPTVTGPEPAETGGPSEAELTADSTCGVSVPASGTRGATVQVDVGAGYAATEVVAYIFSTPISLGAHTVAADGTISVTIPATIAGDSHRIAVYAGDGTLIGWGAITLSATSTPSGEATSTPSGDKVLAATGAGDVRGLVALATLLLSLGGVLLLVRRHRRATA